jgi:hypothetical protein
MWINLSRRNEIICGTKTGLQPPGSEGKDQRSTQLVTTIRDAFGAGIEKESYVPFFRRISQTHRDFDRIGTCSVEGVGSSRASDSFRY